MWATKGREPVIDDTIGQEIRWSIRMTAREDGAIVHAIGMMLDHIHIAVSIPPGKAIGAVVGKLKGAAAHKVNHRSGAFPKAFAWQHDYAVLSFGERHLSDVVAYIEHQRDRHAVQHLWDSLEYVPDPPLSQPPSEEA